jgi:MFS family permease
MFSAITAVQKRTLLAASLGWMLDGMDVMLYAMALTAICRDLRMSPAASGLLMSLTLVASAVGGAVFGVLADRVGRARALMGSILVYSIFTGASGLARNVVQLAVFRTLLGLGMGGEWATGAALVAETWPDQHRAKALGLVQSSWAVGYALAAALTAVVLPRWGWRALFFIGILPALATLWIRRHVPEPELWRAARHRPTSPSARGPFRTLFSPSLRGRTLVVTAMNAASMFGYWGLFTWIPGYLSMPAAQGGRGLDIVRTSSWMVLMLAGAWLGYVSFGFIADRAGRVRTYCSFLVAAAVLVPFYGAAHSPLLLLLLGPFVGFFGSGYFTGFGAIASELFPTPVRGTAMGFAYNLGRGLSATAPYAVGWLSLRYGLGTSFLVTSAAFALAAAVAATLEETRGRPLE